MEQAALFYVILSECVRILAIVIVVVSYFNVKILNKSVSVLMLYCVVMGYMNFGTSSDNTLFGNAPVNMFYFKKEKNIPIIHGTFAAVYYMYMLIFSYFFAAKYISPKIIQKK